MSLISDISAFSNPYGKPAKGKWNLVPGIWTSLSSDGVPVVFYTETRSGDGNSGFHTAIDQIADSGSRRLAIYEYPYRDGQRVKDLGRKGETYNFNIKFFGPNYQEKYKEFYQEVYLSGEVGKLQHPVLSGLRGVIETRLQSFEPIHRHDEFNSVTFKAVFIEDNTNKIDFIPDEEQTPDTALQGALQSLVKAQSAISIAITTASGFLQLPGALISAVIARKNSLMGQISGLLGQLGSTFSSTSNLIGLLVGAGGFAGGITSVTGGSEVSSSFSGSTQVAKIPPAFQVGLDPTTRALVEAHIDSFVNANQVTTQQAVFMANNARTGIAAAIAEIENTFGNYGYDIVLQYRQLAVTIQQTTEACITASQSKVKTYVTPRAMSLRMIAFQNGLSADRQNDIENLNPFLGSVNYVPRGSTVIVPAA